MKNACTFALCLAASLQLSTASAQVYQWKDSTGKTVISDTPPPSSTKGSRTVSSSASAASAVAAPKTSAEKDMDFKLRQQAGKQKADDEAKQQAAAAEKKDNCQRARQHLAALESGERLMVRDESGGRHFMEDAQRQQETERTRKILDEHCK